MSTVPQQTFEGNGVTIEYPCGYATFEDYTKTLEINLRIAKSKPKLNRFIEQILEDIKLAEKATG